MGNEFFTVKQFSVVVVSSHERIEGGGGSEKLEGLFAVENKVLKDSDSRKFSVDELLVALRVIFPLLT